MAPLPNHKKTKDKCGKRKRRLRKTTEKYNNKNSMIITTERGGQSPPGNIPLHNPGKDTPGQAPDLD